MKLNSNINTTAFLQQLQECTGEVYFTTEEGDILNLKSTLSRYLFVTIPVSSKMFKNGSIQCTDETDYFIIKDYLEDTNHGRFI